MDDSDMKLENNSFIRRITINDSPPLQSVQISFDQLELSNVLFFVDEIKKGIAHPWVIEYEGEGDCEDMMLMMNNFAEICTPDNIGTRITLRITRTSNDKFFFFLWISGDGEYSIKISNILVRLNVINEKDRNAITAAYRQATLRVALYYQHSTLIGLCTKTILDNIDANELTSFADDIFFEVIEGHLNRWLRYPFWKDKVKLRSLLVLYQIKKTENHESTMIGSTISNDNEGMIEWDKVCQSTEIVNHKNGPGYGF